MRPSKSTRFRAIVGGQLRQMRGSVALAALCMLGATVTDLLAPWPLKIIVDHVLMSKPLPDALGMLQGLFARGQLVAAVVVSASIVVIAAAGGVFDYVQIYVTSRIGYGIVYTLRREMFGHLQALSLAYHHRARSGELLTKVAGDTTALKDAFADSALTFAAQILTIVGMLAIMMALNPQLSAIVLATLPILGATLFYLYRKINTSARKQRKQEGAIASRISEILGSITLVQAFGRERYERERFETESAQTLHESLRTARMEAAATRTMELLSALGIWIVVVFGAVQVLGGRMLLGEMLIFVTYVTNMYKPIRSLAKLSTRFSKAAVSAERIAEVLAIEPDIQDAPRAISAAGLLGAIAFDNVAFAYGAGAPVLRDVAFAIRPGQQVALVGASGAGKSTITSLLLRLYEPSGGTITLDGLDIRAYRRESLRQQIGMLLQDSILFGASIRENIAYGKPQATQAEIEAAARAAYAHDFIMALPEGYATILGEGGSTISGGQRQRICLARAIIKRPAVLILDEPTSAIDAESAALIQAAIQTVQRGKTTLVIAHTFGFIEHFDQILVLDKGMIVERGTHRELLARRGYYYDLYRMQALDAPAPLPEHAPTRHPEAVFAQAPDAQQATPATAVQALAVSELGGAVLPATRSRVRGAAQPAMARPRSVVALLRRMPALGLGAVALVALVALPAVGFGPQRTGSGQREPDVAQASVPGVARVDPAPTTAAHTASAAPAGAAALTPPPTATATVTARVPAATAEAASAANPVNLDTAMETTVPATATLIPPTATRLAAAPVRSTPVPPTAAPVRNTPVPPTATPVPPTATPVPPTATPVPPTATPVPPAPVAAPAPAASDDSGNSGHGGGDDGGNSGHGGGDDSGNSGHGGGDSGNSGHGGDDN